MQVKAEEKVEDKVEDQEEEKVVAGKEEKADDGDEEKPEAKTDDADGEDNGEEKAGDEEKGEEGDKGSKRGQPLPPWLKKRLDSYTKRYHDERRGRQAAEERASSLEQAMQALSDRRAKGEDDEEVEQPIRAKSDPAGKTDDQLVEERAKQIVKTERFTEACNTLYDKGEEEFKDWPTVMDNINALGGFAENPTVLSIALELPNSHKLIHQLGSDPELADKIFNMTPVKMTVELTRLSDEINKPKRDKLSEAPEPVKSLKNSKAAPSEQLKDEDSTEEWMRKREKQVAED